MKRLSRLSRGHRSWLATCPRPRYLSNKRKDVGSPYTDLQSTRQKDRTERPEKQKAALSSSGEPQGTQLPTRRQLWQLFLLSAVPFVGFGFADNFIMIVAGDAIDNSIGLRLGLSTLAAAGLGNLISDVCGIGLGEVKSAI